MQFREHPGVMGKRDAYPFDPRLLKIETGYNVRDLDAADEREDLNELKESIRANGVRVPIEVRMIDDDVFIIAGHRRHKAVMELIAEGEPIKAVPVLPEPKNTPPEDRIINLVISNSGKPLKPLQVAEVVRRLVAFGWEKQLIATRLGKSASSISGYLDMIAMPEPVKDQVRENVISATEAAKVVRNLPAGTDPKFAADLIEKNKEENKRLGVGRKNNHKVTAKTLKRDKPKAETKPKEEPAHDAASETDRTIFDEQVPGTAAVPLNDPYLTEMLNRANDPGEEAKPDLPSGLPATSETDPVQRAHEDRQAAPQAPRRLNNRVDELTLQFTNVDCDELAGLYIRLVKENDEARAEGETSLMRWHLFKAADHIGHARFEDKWESAKASSELAMVA